MFLFTASSRKGIYFRGMANLASASVSSAIGTFAQYSALAPDASVIPTAIIANRAIGPGPKLVYSRLLAYAATNDAATNNRLAADLAVSPRSIRNYIAALKAAGLVETQLHAGKPRSFRLTTPQ
jgi:hypothetical protein